MIDLFEFRLTQPAAFVIRSILPVMFSNNSMCAQVIWYLTLTSNRHVTNCKLNHMSRNLDKCAESWVLKCLSQLHVYMTYMHVIC